MRVKDLRFSFALLFVIEVAAWAQPVAIKPSVKIEGARFRAMQIAVPDVKAENPKDSDAVKIAAQMTQIIRNNLTISGVFNVLNPKSYVADAAKEGLSREATNFDRWIAVGAEGVTKTQVTIKRDQIYTSNASFQVASQRTGGVKSYHSPQSEFRRLSNQISDDIYQFFTGDKGMFSSKIAATKEFGGAKHIIVMDLDGSNQVQVTQTGNINVLPTFISSDSLFFTSIEGAGNANLYETKISNRNRVPISVWPGINMSAQIAPSKQKVALTLSKDGISQIYVTNRYGKNPTRLTDGLNIELSPFWNPDGSQLAFVSARSGNPQIYIMNADGSGAQRITFQGNYNQTPRWSPKGDAIAFTGRDEENKFDVFLYDLKTKQISRVTEGQGNNEDPWFTPNGNNLVFTSTRTGKREIFLSSLTGEHQVQITRGGQYWTPSVSPGG